MSIFRSPRVREPDTKGIERRLAEERTAAQRFAAEQENERGLKLIRVQRTGVKA